MSAERQAAIGETIAAYGAAWNEPDEGERTRLLERAWAEDGVYTDPQSQAEGRRALAQLISGFQRQMHGARLVLVSGVDSHHESFRFAWRMVDGDGATMTDGMDYGELDGSGRIRRIVGFFGTLPALPS